MYKVPRHLKIASTAWNSAQFQQCRLLKASNRRLPQQAAGVRTNGAQSGVLKLILYSKPECHLCHGLKEKVDLAIEKARYMPSELSDAEVEVRDISTNPYWEKKYGLVIPVLTVNRPGSEDEVKVRRVPPRSSSDKVAEHIIAAVRGEGPHIGDDS